MTCEEVLARIKPHEAELRAAGMKSLYVFGSTARNEARPDSDIDLSCDISMEAPIGLFEFFHLQDRLETILSSAVDLVERQALYPRVARHAAPDMVRVF